MRGLFIKDYCLLLKQRTAAVLILLFAAFFILLGENPSMGISYTIFVASSIIMGTQGYDEADHGMAFLMTLPTGRKLYVKEKYTFGIVNVFVLWLVLLAVGIGVQAFRGIAPFSGAGLELIAGALITLVVCNIFYFVMVPAQLKFGPEKSRWVLLLMLGGCFAMIFLVMMVAETINNASVWISLPFRVNMAELPVGVILLAAAILAAFVWAAVLAISYMISLRIIQKKEY